MEKPVAHKEGLPGQVRAVSSLLVAVSAIAITAMMLHIAIDVFSRLLLGHHIVGTLEYVTYFDMVAVVFLPLGRVQEERGHVIVEVIYQLLPEKANLWIDRGAQIFTLSYIVFLGYWG